MSAEEFKLAIQLLCIFLGPFLAYNGFRVVFDKKYYMRITEGYVGDDVDAEYEKLSSFHRQYRRYKGGLTALSAGVLLLVLFVWITFFHQG